jgi:amino acid transporter
MSIMLDYFLVPGLVYVVAALAMNTIIPQIPYQAWVLIFLVPMTTISVLGIKLTARANNTLLAIELAALVIFFVLSIAYIITRHIPLSIDPLYNASSFKISSILNAASIAVLSYLGFDAATTLAEEHRGKAKFVGRAVVLSVLAIGIMFISQTYLAYLVYPTYQFSNPDTAFYDVAQTVGGLLMLSVATISTAIAWGIGDGLNATTAIARIIYAMGRDGFLPRAVAKVHSKFGTPWVATIIGGAISTLIAILVPLDLLVSLVNFGALTAFILLHIAVIYYFTYRKRHILYVLIPIAGLIVLVPIWWGLSMDAKILGIAWLSLWLIYMAVITRGFRSKLLVPGM